MEHTQKYLDARAKIAEDLYKEHKITYWEMVRLQCDAMLGEDTGDVRYRIGQEPKKDNPHHSE